MSQNDCQDGRKHQSLRGDFQNVRRGKCVSWREVPEQKRQMSKLETEVSEPEERGVNEESVEKTFQVGERGVKDSGKRGVIVGEKCQNWREKCQRVKRGVKGEKEVSMSWKREGSKQEREVSKQE